MAAIYCRQAELLAISLEHTKPWTVWIFWKTLIAEEIAEEPGMNLALAALYMGTCFVATLCFNLDTKHVIKRGAGIANAPEDGSSYFGYSIALHRDYLNRPHIIAGAPRRVWNTIKHPGAVYLCPLVPAEGEECWPAYIPRDSKDSKFSHVTEWMGGSVASGETGRFVACAHRHVQAATTKSGRRWDSIGRCVVYSRHFSVEGVYKPCEYHNHEANQKFYEKDCQAGMSVALGNNDQTLIMGAPGAAVWLGAVFTQQLTFSNTGKLSETPQDGLDNYTQSFTLQGYSLSVGYFLPGSNDSLLQFAVGVPRWTALGQFGRVDVFTQNVETGKVQLIKQFTVYGQYSGSFFGHTILAADVTGDGLDELFVAGPTFSDSRAEIGRVWIFKNLNGRFSTQEMELTGSVPFGRFGHAISLLGDINKDGFNDVAISAPFDGKDHSSGKIYIYLGSPHLVRYASQVISASDVSHKRPTPMAFGAALVGAFDADEDGYPDLAVGSYLSEEVFLLRARPVVTIKATVTLTPSLVTSRTPQMCLGSSGQLHTCIAAKICFDFSTDLPSALSYLNYRLTLDRPKKDLGLKTRGFFNATGHRRILGEIQFNQSQESGQICHMATVFLSMEFSDRRTPVEVLLKYTVPSDHQARSSNVSLYHPLPSVMNHTFSSQRRNVVKAHIHFAQECGSDGLCIPDLQLHDISALDLGPNAAYVLGHHSSVTFQATISNKGDKAYETKLLITTTDLLSLVGVNISSVSTFCVQDQTYNETLVECDLGDLMLTGASHTVDIILSTIQVPPSVTSLDIKFSVSSSNRETRSTLGDNTARLLVSVISKANLTLDGVGSHEQYLLHQNYSQSPHADSEIGGSLTYSIFVSNSGPSTVSQASLLLALPTHTQNRQPLLYVMNVKEIGNVYCNDERIVNPFGIRTRTQMNLELKLGQHEPVIEPAIEPLSQSLETVESPGQSLENKTETSFRDITADLRNGCETGFIHCTVMTCYVNDLTGGGEAGITVTARLWESSLASQDFSQLRLSVIGYVQPVNSPTLTGSVTDHVVISTTIKHWASERSGGGLPPWAYGVVVVCPLLVITGTIIILRKVGFFKRPTKEKLKEEKRKSEMCLEELEMAELEQKDNKNDSDEERDS